MVNMIIFLVVSLIMLISLDYFVGDKYFYNGCKKYYYMILKSILNILIIVFIILQRNQLASIHEIQNILMIIATIIGIYNIIRMKFCVKVLKRYQL